MLLPAISARRRVPSLFTGAAYLWGWMLGSGRIRTEGKLIILRGLPDWAYARGGITVGRCYLTGNNVSPAVLRHELIHVRQWERHGTLFPLLYLLAGSVPSQNRFEVEAGLQDGGYT